MSCCGGTTLRSRWTSTVRSTVPHSKHGGKLRDMRQVYSSHTAPMSLLLKARPGASMSASQPLRSATPAVSMTLSGARLFGRLSSFRQLGLARPRVSYTSMSIPLPSVLSLVPVLVSVSTGQIILWGMATIYHPGIS